MKVFQNCSALILYLFLCWEINLRGLKVSSKHKNLEKGIFDRDGFVSISILTGSGGGERLPPFPRVQRLCRQRNLAGRKALLSPHITVLCTILYFDLCLKKKYFSTTFWDPSYHHWANCNITFWRIYHQMSILFMFYLYFCFR